MDLFDLDGAISGESKGNRRRFLQRLFRGVSSLVGAGACLLLWGCTAPIRTFRARIAPVVQVSVPRYPELDQPGGMIKVLLKDKGSGGGSVFIRNEGGGSFQGISAVCTHQGCPVDATRNGFSCPCHGSVYDREGKNIAGPARRPLPRFRAERDGDVIQLFLEREAQVEGP